MVDKHFGSRTARSTEIHANVSMRDLDRFQRTYLEAREKYLEIPGVLGVGYRRSGNSRDKENVELVVLANRKLTPQGLFDGDPSSRTLNDIPIIIREPHVELDISGKHKHEGHQDLMIIDWCKVHRMHLEELAKSPPAPAPDIIQQGQVFVIRDNGTLIVPSAITVFDSVDWALAYHYFLQHYGDDYDFVAMIVDHDSGMPGNIPSFGDTVFNDVIGINHWKDANLGDFNNRPCYETSRLQGLEVLWPMYPPPSYVPPDTPPTTRYGRLMEIAHRWGAYVRFKKSASDTTTCDDLLDGTLYHWGRQFYSDASPLESESWWTSSGGSFSTRALNDDEYTYCDLDLYLMGLLADNEVLPFSYFDGLSPSTTSPAPSTLQPLTPQNIAFAHGWRVPTAANSQRSFRQAFIVLTKDLAKGTALAQKIDLDRLAHVEEFRLSTRSRAVLDTYLYDNSHDHIYIRDNTGDNGDDATTGVFWDSPDIWVRKHNDGRLIHQDTVRGQDNWIYVRVHNKGSQQSKEITVNVYRANFVGTQLLYPQDWRVEDRIGSQVIAGGVSANGQIILEFKWAQSMIPPATGWHPCLLVEILPIHRDVLATGKLHSVSENRRIAQKNITILDPPFTTISLAFPFFIGTCSLPCRRVRIHVVQTKGARFTATTLQLGLSHNDWVAGLKKIRLPERAGEDGATDGRTSLTTLCTGGEVVEQEDMACFVIFDAFRGGDVILPLDKGERRKLTLRLDWCDQAAPNGARFEVTQIDETNKIVGGVSLVFKHSAARAIKAFLNKIVKKIWRKISTVNSP